MWLIDKIKKLFKKTIECPIKSREELVFMFVPKGRTIKLNTILEVPKNFVAFIRAKDCLLDYFIEGSYKMSLITLPKTAKKLKLNKANKDGELKTNFKADVFYVNLNKFENVVFNNTEKINLTHKIYKGLFGKFKGSFDLSVFNPEEFLNALLTEWAVIKGNMALEQVKIYVGDIVSRQLNLLNIDFFNFEDNNENLLNNKLPIITNKLNKLGLKVENIKIDRTIVSQKSLKKLEQAGELYGKDVNLQSPTDANINLVEQIEQSSFDNYKNNSPFAPQIEDFEMETKQINFEINEQKNCNANEVIESSVVQNNQNAETNTQTNNVMLEFAQCPNCGTYLSINASVCFNCGYDFNNKNRCQKCGSKLHKGEIICENCGTVNLKPNE